jgi:acyl-CoA dehydrogenase
MRPGDLFTAEQQDFRHVLRDFLEKEVVPVFHEWETAGEVPRSLFKRLAELGITGMAVPTEYGGAGENDYRYNVILQEETARATVTLGSLRTQLDVINPYFINYGDADQRARWLPGIAAGELFTAIALTEPEAGSDLAGIRATARLDGDHYVLSGAKTLITGGWLADLVIVLARTSEAPPGDRRAGLSLLVVEDGMPGFTKGRKLDKIGLRSQDTAELSFQDVHVPVANLLGDEGNAFAVLSHNLARERLAIAVGALAQATAAHTVTVEYVKSRRAFGTTIGSFQNTKFELAAVAAELAAGQALVDQAVSATLRDELSGSDAAKVKLFCTELQGRVVDRCLQLFGGYGYIKEYPIARLYADARVTRIYGGTSEVMKSIISKSLGL